MKTRTWCLASASVLCLCLGAPTFADNNSNADQLRGASPRGQDRGGQQGQGGSPSRGQERPGNYGGGNQAPQWQPQPGYNRPDYGRPSQGWQNNPNGNDRPQPQRPDNTPPIQPKPGEVRQTQSPLRGSYPDLPRPNGNHQWQAGGDRDHGWDPHGHGNGWGPGPQYRPGQRIDRFPGDNYRVPYRGNDYFYSSGYWYRPNGPGYVVVAPPRGIRVRYLPDYATRVWIGSGMFFMAAGTYYQWVNDTQEYVVVDPPTAPVQSQPQPVPQPVAAPSGYDVAFYPANGQTPSQMERDRYDCQRWAAQQTGFDPATATYAPADEVVYLFRQNMANCLSSRGYGLN
ncbi:DUF6515 family protein [Pseudomonas sp. RIT-PI-S]|uniref:DUF6515 family protein n=1 Tax=Pseudomonas sp. RIT-PI-S TaxID=3035295 RepID=UPI0021D8ED91|nr:DUF6515 family protein [Pseudomonas sp. RIT-PI-S]